MEDNDLKSYLSVFGDRIAVKQYCRNSISGKTSCSEKAGTKKELLLGKLRSKLKSRKRTCQLPDDSDGEDSIPWKCLSGNTNAQKICRQIELGWINEGKQVRAKSGGGTRNVYAQKSAIRNDLLAIAKNLFFPNGVSTFGPLHEFTFDICDFKMTSLNDEVTVAELYENSKMPKLRFYLTTVKCQQERNKDANIALLTSSDDDDFVKSVSVINAFFYQVYVDIMYRYT
jgi:hypothetical protein